MRSYESESRVQIASNLRVDYRVHGERVWTMVMMLLLLMMLMVVVTVILKSRVVEQVSYGVAGVSKTITTMTKKKSKKKSAADRLNRAR